MQRANNITTQRTLPAISPRVGGGIKAFPPQDGQTSSVLVCSVFGEFVELFQVRKTRPFIAVILATVILLFF